MFTNIWRETIGNYDTGCEKFDSSINLHGSISTNDLAIDSRYS